jgi:uncharacterized protein (TIGR02231 family)
VQQVGCGLLIACSIAVAQPAEETIHRGAIENVTLYRDQALVTRVLRVDAPAGPSTWVIGELPERIVGDSLFASAGSEVEVRAVRFRTRAVSEAPRAEVRELDTQLAAIAEKLIVIKARLDVGKRQEEYLDRFDTFMLNAGRAELGKGALDSDSMIKLTNYVFEQRRQLSEQQLTASTEQRALVEQQQLLQARRSELAVGNARNLREALVFIDNKGRGPVELRLSYEVRGVGWSPSYNLRASTTSATVRLSYNATIQQASGEDWSQVALTLSTASPRLRAKSPDVAPFMVALMVPSAEQGQAPQQLQQAYETARGNLRAATANQKQRQGFQGDNRMLFEMNKWANEAQSIELLGGNDAVSAARGSDEGLAVSYQIVGRVSLDSRVDQQLLQVAALDLEGRNYFVASPVLSSYVFRHADITNSSALALLAGELAVYLDGQFIGNGEMLEVAPGQLFTVGLGTDSQLRATREVVSREERTQGGNRLLELRYRLKLTNFKGQPVKVRLIDRLPSSSREQEIRVTLGTLEQPLSTDPLYLSDERPFGILRWDIEVPGNASSERALVVPYSFTVEFDRTRTIGTPGAQEEGTMLEQFEKLQEQRYNRR